MERAKVLRAAGVLLLLMLFMRPGTASAGAAAPPVRAETLSLFESPRAGACEWSRADLLRGERVPIASFDRDCTGVGVAWSPDGSEAIVDFPGGWSDRADRHTHHAFLVRFQPGGEARVAPLPVPTAGILDQLFFDPDGAPVALFLDGVDALPGSGTLRFQGRAYAVPDAPGIPLLAHAFRREQGRWRRVETVATTAEACDAPGTMLLDAAAYHRQGPTTFRMLDPTWGHEVSTEPIPQEWGDALARHERIDAEAFYAWVRLSTEQGAVLAVEANIGYTYLTTPVVIAGERGMREIDGLPEGAILAAASRGPWLLLSEAVSGARPTVFDLEGRLVFSAPTAVAATFWPHARPDPRRAQATP